MRMVVLVCSALLALAVGFEVYSSEYPPTALIDFVQSQPLLQKLAWGVIVAAPFALLAAALWESEKLDQQRKANAVWETRFRGVRKTADELDDAQKDADRATDYLERTDPEEAMSALQRRLIEAERTTHLQQSRNEKEGLRVRVDMARRQVFLAGEEIHLTPIEYRLLTTLVKYAGKVVTHRQLLKEVWGPNSVFETHYLRVYMGHLRQKIEADSARPKILLTEPGVGYRLAYD